jgi:hypothetical protein
MHLRALLALNNGNRADYMFYKSRLETLGTYGSMDPPGTAQLRGGKAGYARWLLNDLRPFDQPPDLSYEGGGGGDAD